MEKTKNNAPKFYYWIDLNFLDGDYNRDKFALFRGEFDEDGRKDRSTEEIVFWRFWADVPGYLELDESDDGEFAVPWDYIDGLIKAELGFVADYEVG